MISSQNAVSAAESGPEEAPASAAPGPAAPCPLCGADHSEIVRFLAEMSRNRVPTSEWLLDREALLLDIAEERRRDRMEGDYWGYLQHRLAIVEAELRRRRELEQWGGPRIDSKARISREVLAEIKRRADLVSVLSRYVEVIPGNRWPQHYRCPGHGDGLDRHPSGAIYEDGHYWCFVCNAGGDALTALQSFGGLTFQQAVEELARETGVKLAPSPGLSSKAKGVEL